MTPSKDHIDMLVEMQEGSRKRPWLCRLGFHRVYQVEQLITTGYSACADCGAMWMTSLWGDFGMSRAESARTLRARAAALKARSQLHGGDDE